MESHNNPIYQLKHVHHTHHIARCGYATDLGCSCVVIVFGLGIIPKKDLERTKRDHRNLTGFPQETFKWLLWRLLIDKTGLTVTWSAMEKHPGHNQLQNSPQCPAYAQESASQRLWLWCLLWLMFIQSFPFFCLFDNWRFWCFDEEEHMVGDGEMEREREAFICSNVCC